MTETASEIPQFLIMLISTFGEDRPPLGNNEVVTDEYAVIHTGSGILAGFRLKSDPIDIRVNRGGRIVSV